MGRNQIDVALDIETILIESGLEYEIAYNPDEKVYYFKLTNIDAEPNEDQYKEKRLCHYDRAASFFACFSSLLMEVII